MPEVGGPAVVIVGVEGEPTSSFAADVRRLSYRPVAITWAAGGFQVHGGAPIATVVDFRALGVHAEQACRAVQRDRVLRRTSVIALVFEQEGPRLDLSLGFDDVILAPYRLSELAARLRLARWRLDSNSSPERLRVGSLTLNPATYEVAVNRAPIELTLKEYQLLLFLMRNPGRVFSRQEILDHVWELDYLGGTRTVDVHVRRLRAKTEAAGDLFETVRGVGYRLVAPAAEVD